MLAYQKLENLCAKMHVLNNVGSILSWDKAVNLPEGSIGYRAEQEAAIASLAHDLLTGDQLGDLLAEGAGGSLDEWQRRNLFLIKKAREEALVIDNQLLSAFIKASSISEMKWRQARADNDFVGYKPYLKEVVALATEMATRKAEKFGTSLYDALIQTYEPELTSVKVDQQFAMLGSFLTDFIPQVLERQKSQDFKPLPTNLNFSDAQQFALGKDIMKRLNFDFTKGRVDLSTHPQCGGHSGDVRITTRFDPQDPISGFMGVIHETGHALYEQNKPSKYLSQPVGAAIGMAMHESQSLLIEMQLGRSKEFSQFVAPLFREVLGLDLMPDHIYQLLNHVKPDFIRVDADEVTYPAHVIMRYNLERQIIGGQLPIDDLPEAWNSELKRLLGITPPTDTLGCLQDIHWPMGAFGYFPSYSLGAIMAAQWFETAKTQLPTLSADITSGKFTVLTDWLSHNLHSQGSLLYSEELLTKVTGRGLDASGYMTYLKKKFLP